MIEIEKKYNLSEEDYSIIRNKCTFISNKNILDIFFDTHDFQLFRKKIKLRNRNSQLQLKRKISNHEENYSKSIELIHIEEIKDELLKNGIVYENVEKVLEVFTEVEKYQYQYNGYNFIIDIQRYKYNNRYEIELELENDISVDPEVLINNLRKDLGLTAKEQNSTETKIITCAKNENPALYEIILNTKS